MSEDQGPSVASDNPSSPEDRLRELGMQLKQHIEYKEWDALQQLLAIPSVWVIDRSLPVSEAIDAMRALLGSAADIQLTLDRVIRTNITADAANVSLVTRILWSEAETWAEHEEVVEMHLGFRRQEDDWGFSSLGFTAVQPEQPPQAAAPPVAETYAAFVSEGQEEPELPDFLANLIRTIRAQWSWYLDRGFIDVQPPAYLGRMGSLFGEAPAPPPVAPPSTTHAIVYMPVFVPTDLLKQHLPK
jgi:hypothetical protein